MTETQARSEPQAEAQTSKQQRSIQDEISLNHQLANYDYGNIRNDPDLTREAKIRKLTEAHEQATQKHKEIVKRFEVQERARYQELEREVFAAPQPGMMASAGDRANHHMSLRDGLSRAEEAHERDMAASAEKRHTTYLSDMLARAELTGDEHLAYSVFQIAREKGREQIVNQYLSSRPEKRAKFEELRSLGTENQDVMGLVGRAMWMRPPPRPPELLGRNF